MYSNTKDLKAIISKPVTAIGVVETIDLSGENRMFDEWAFQIAGFATKVIDAVTLNGGFETAGGGGADVFADWAETAQGSTALSQDAVVFHSGANSCKIVVDAVGTFVGAVDQDVMTAGKSYTLTLWAIGAVGGEVLEVYSQGTLVGTFTLTAAWAQYSTAFVADAAKLIIMTKADAVNNGATVNIDDVVLSDVAGFMRAPTDFAGTLELSLDGVNWTSIQSVTEADQGVIKYLSSKLSQRFRVNVSAITTADSVTDAVYVNVIAS